MSKNVICGLIRRLQEKELSSELSTSEKAALCAFIDILAEM